MTSQSSTADVMGNWKEWFDKSAEAWSKMAGGTSPGDVTQKSRDMFAAWSDSWMKFFSQSPSNETMQAAQNIWAQQMQTWTSALTQAFKTQSADPTEIWRQMVSAWTDSWIISLAQMPTAESRRAMQAIWSQQLESWTNTIAEAMSSDQFAEGVAQSTEQWLTAQENWQSAMHPQIDAMLRMFNVPSRTQVNRLFEEVAELRSSLDALADQNRVILREMLSQAKSPSRAPFEDNLG